MSYLSPDHRAVERETLSCHVEFTFPVAQPLLLLSALNYILHSPDQLTEGLGITKRDYNTGKKYHNSHMPPPMQTLNLDNVAACGI